MPMIPTAALGLMRAEIQKFMIDTVSIYSITNTYDGYGKATKSRTLRASVNGQLAEPNGNESKLLTTYLSEGTKNVETMKLVLPYGTTININDEVDTADGKTWQVAWTNSSATLTAATIALLTREINNE